MTLSLLTLNIWNNGGSWPERRARIRACLDELDPDLVGFQEVLVGEGQDQAAELFEGRGYQLEFARASDFWMDPKIAFGNAVASRWPIGDREVLTLPDAGDGEARCALSVTTQTPFGPVALTCTHLNWKFDHGHVRERQVVALWDTVRRRAPAEGFPSLLVGDFNAEPDATEIRFLKGLHSLEGRSAYLRDAWQHAGDGGSGTTWSNRNPYARSWLEPDRRIDFIFCGPPNFGAVGRVERCRVVCDEPLDGIWPSDHFGVFAEFRTEPDPNVAPDRRDSA